jgi:hypothetical protein
MNTSCNLAHHRVYFLVIAIHKNDTSVFIYILTKFVPKYIIFYEGIFSFRLVSTDGSDSSSSAQAIPLDSLYDSRSLASLAPLVPINAPSTNTSPFAQIPPEGAAPILDDSPDCSPVHEPEPFSFI